MPKTLEQQGRKEHDYQEKISILGQIVREERPYRDQEGSSRPRANSKPSTKSWSGPTTSWETTDLVTGEDGTVIAPCDSPVVTVL